MNAVTGFLLGVLCTVCVGAIAYGLWKVDKVPAWDHSPTDEEIGQRILEDFILPKEQ